MVAGHLVIKSSFGGRENGKRKEGRPEVGSGTAGDGWKGDRWMESKGWRWGKRGK